MEERTNRRGHKENYVEGFHLKINDLRQRVQHLRNQYLEKTNIIPTYPRPEIHVSHLKHDTDQAGLCGIQEDGGFKDPGNDSLKLLWWSLAVGPYDITSAEKRLLEKTYPDQTQEQAQRQQSFLWKFATSPAFKETSRLGSYRFTFPLEELLEAYKQQCCSGAQPVMRVFKTVLYKQEVMYVVLVHSPANQELFSEYPELTDDPNAVCVYKDGRFVWRPEAMCETHRYELIQSPGENLMEVRELASEKYYVWDHLSVALHMEEGKVLEIGPDRLRDNLKFCYKDEVQI
ncbi:uncharacterized protein LOC113143254 [Mastacembelus armatus]|uniref:uncharacterized protein LOC113143071 n=1 Tax=Mastacembelus armatus TaxID=205130 RepID=UPI000E462F0A|nr:uncharacterized protein LOC113143071 [Mastacembelus armatus]XP_026184560.1 uncharacterized protein LOC113143254 [Mastacembelus armatus]